MAGLRVGLGVGPPGRIPIAAASSGRGTSGRMTTTSADGVRTGAAASARDLVKIYGKDETEVRALDGVTIDLLRRRVHRRHGALGLRQVDPDALPGGARHPDQRRGRRRRYVAVRAQGQGAHRAAAGADRLRLPVVQPDPDADRRGEHPAAAGPRRPQARPRVVRPGHRRRRAARPAQPPAQRDVRRPAAAGRVRPRAGQPARRSSSPTSRPATSTAPAAPRCSASCGAASTSSGRRS